MTGGSLTGGVASLNHRLIARNPPGFLGIRLCREGTSGQDVYKDERFKEREKANAPCARLCLRFPLALSGPYTTLLGEVSEDEMRDCIAIAKALGDPQRVRALMALQGGKLCLCQIIELLTLSPSTVSKHMAILNQVGLVEASKEGRWVYYRLTGGQAHTCITGAVRWLKGCLRKDSQVREDAQRLKAVCRLSKKEMGACYKRANGV